ncbi:MAG: DUF896 domain-containing protein [Clostridia bacterium]|nr:DUF896 domain-containing protein [Clostridia bacterium]
MVKEKIDRINELARKAKAEGLTEEETKERQALRAEYIAEFRGSLRSQLDGISIQRPDGSVEPLKKKSN